jgi:hypothetical protein
MVTSTASAFCGEHTSIFQKTRWFYIPACFTCLLLPPPSSPPLPQVGVVDMDPEEVMRKGRLMPGNIFLVDFEEHRVVEDKEMKER